jgi:hypothetical protein
LVAQPEQVAAHLIPCKSPSTGNQQPIHAATLLLGFGPSALSKRISFDRDHLQQLFNSKTPPEQNGTAAPIAPPAPAHTVRERQIAIARKRLGLSATPTPHVEFKPSTTPAAPIETYENALHGLVDTAIREDGASPDIASRYIDIKAPPAKLLQQMNIARTAIEKEPIDVWGIRTSRVLEFQYAGSNFQFPYLFVASTLIVLLPALVAGWMTSVYMTRQRELNEIFRAKTISSVFPHILNIFPVTYAHIQRQSLSETEWRAAAVLYAFFRLVVITVLISPMIFAYTYSAIHIWPFSSAVNLAIPFLIYIVFQIIGIYAQEAMSLRSKFFAEI